MFFKKKKILYVLVILVCLIGFSYFSSGVILSFIGDFLVIDEDPVICDAVVVLNTGVEYYPRLIEAAHIYTHEHVKRVVINGNRKSDTLRGLEEKGFAPCCQWYEDQIRILELLGVPREAVLAISAEDVYDTVGEAQMVGDELLNKGIKSIIISTSKYHTRRAGFIWKRMYGNHLKISIVAAKSDPYDPKGWWRSGRQIRWVLAEYGAWLYYYWKKFYTDDKKPPTTARIGFSFF